MTTSPTAWDMGHRTNTPACFLSCFLSGCLPSPHAPWAGLASLLSGTRVIFSKAYWEQASDGAARPQGWGA